MTGQRRKKRKAFKREALVRTLKAQGNHRWRDALRSDLSDLQEHAGGMDHLAAAIKAVLRSDKWKR